MSRPYTTQDAMADALARFRAQQEGRLDEWIAADKLKRERRARIGKLARRIATGRERQIY